MTPSKVYCTVILLYFFCAAACVSDRNQKAEFVVNASGGRPIPPTFFGIFFEINHTGAGGLWAELVSNRENYPKFYHAIKRYYPGIRVISNCDGSVDQLDYPADLYDFHIYKNASDFFSNAHHFDHTSRSGPKVFVSEYAVHREDAGTGSLLAELGEAGFLIGLERNSDVVAMVCYAPLFVNVHDRSWNPYATVFNSYQAYGTPSYWLQHFFTYASGAMLLDATLLTNSSTSNLASAIAWRNSNDGRCFLKVEVVNFGSIQVKLKISMDGLGTNLINSSRSTKTLLTSNNVIDENSFNKPKEVVPRSNPLESAGKDMEVVSPHTITYDLMLDRKC